MLYRNVFTYVELIEKNRTILYDLEKVFAFKSCTEKLSMYESEFIHFSYKSKMILQNEKKLISNYSSFKKYFCKGF